MQICGQQVCEEIRRLSLHRTSGLQNFKDTCRAISCVSATPGQGPTACILPVLLQSRVKTWINGLLPAADDIKASLLSTPSASPYSEKS
ncbi:TPA: hypothetical protein ACH3X1_007764 [Trebouxia sp. C0004]